jgi:hypothetical protein
MTQMAGEIKFPLCRRDLDKVSILRGFGEWQRGENRPLISGRFKGATRKAFHIRAAA